MGRYGGQRVDTEGNDPDWMDDYEPSEIVVSDLDLMSALDHLDSLDQQLQAKLSPTKH